MTVTLLRGDCLEILPTLEENSIDSIVTDPPYGLEFMGKEWDHDVPGIPFWEAALRVAKPGAHLLAFGGTRTHHRLMCAIEDAGWEIRDTVMWVHGNGFPKSLDVSKAIDKAAGAEREVIGKKENSFGRQRGGEPGWAEGITGEGMRQHLFDVTAPASANALRWQGWGTALKPAWEPIIVARKPLIGTVVQNVLEHGTGAINIDGCRIPTEESITNHSRSSRAAISKGIYGNSAAQETHQTIGQNIGRWPSNLLHDGSDEVTELMPQAKAGTAVRHNSGGNTFGGTSAKPPMDDIGYADSGSAARFFYCAKASKSDREEGLDGMPEHDAHATHINQTRAVCNVCGCGTIVAGPGKRMACGHTDIRFEPSIKDKHGNEEGRRNHHPTVKPTALMRWLVRLVTPPGGVVLDPFMGSGSTGKAAVLEGFGFVGIEIDAEYLEIARRRIEHAAMQPPLDGLL